ncbi:hypothetical protein DPMN_156797 [Dreissena polymorpha]|uniref:Uncharacterized protein n=1 Tax=Dreissena polymorpha TaxID=45954 RepID=A0A9D4FRB4_DREPO|nr:hypothetical protein DPMN_156797 [Dreissena polymorpha]
MVRFHSFSIWKFGYIRFPWDGGYLGQPPGNRSDVFPPYCPYPLLDHSGAFGQWVP